MAQHPKPIVTVVTLVAILAPLFSRGCDKVRHNYNHSP